MHRRAAAKAAFRIVLIIAMAVPLVTLSTHTVRADTEVGGPIISDTTWIAANSPYIVVENVEVWEGVTLTIEPGVTVKFDAEKKLQVSGELIARGTEGNIITFTSNEADAAPGDWGQIHFTDTAKATTMDADGAYVSGSILQYCMIRYAGYDTRNALEAGSLLVDHCTVRNNDARGIYAIGTEGAPSRIAYNVVHSNTLGYQYYGGGIYAESSTVTGNTVTGNLAYSKGGGIYAESSTVTSNTISGNSVYGQGGGIQAASSALTNNTVSDNWASWGGGIFASFSTLTSNTVSDNSAYEVGGGIYANRSTVTGNTASHNSTNHKGGGIYANFSTVTSNTVSDNSANEGGGIYDLHSTVLTNTITLNSVSGDDATGSGAYVRDGDFLYNSVVGNTGPLNQMAGGLTIAGTPQVHYNNFYSNEPYDAVVMSSYDISGTNNYWGTVSSVDILSQVYDWHDDSGRGKLLYVPYLQEPSEDAPFPPPTGLRADFQDDIAILSWDAHPSFTTGYGYKVYYDTDSSLPPYEGTGLNEGDAPIDVGDQTAYTLTGLDPSKDYWCGVTAYDNEGHESWYSNVVWKQGGYWIYLPLVLRQ